MHTNNSFVNCMNDDGLHLHHFCIDQSRINTQGLVFILPPFLMVCFLLVSYVMIDAFKMVLNLNTRASSPALHSCNYFIVSLLGQETACLVLGQR